MQNKKPKKTEKIKTTGKKSGTSDKKVFLILGAFAVISLIAIIGSIVVAVVLFDEDDKNDDGDNELVSNEEIELFKSDSEFDDYAQTIVDKQKKENKSSFFDGLGLGGDEDLSESEGSPSPSQDKAGSADDSDTITNVQETGVDEGDIVKAYKDFLIVLRRGRIFSINTKTFKTVSTINAYPNGFKSNGWYDEMLVSDGKIVVIGYNYGQTATEIGLFALGDDGKIVHENTYFVDSNDYYSSRNYASRLIDGELVLYMPYNIYFGDDYRDINFPQIHKWVKGNEVSEGSNLLSKTDIYKPVQDTYAPTLHTVVRCNLESSRDGEDLECDANGIIGPYSRNFYVSNEAIYVWVSDDNYYYIQEKDTDKVLERDAYVYRIDLEDNDFQAMGVKGSPIDQFSFKESDNYLNVLVRSSAWGDSMWFPEASDGDLALFRAPISKFSDKPKATAKKYYAPLPDADGYTIQNRFVGDYLLYGTNSGWWANEDGQSLYIKKIEDDSDVEIMELKQTIERIDVLGSDAIIVGAESDDLVISSIDPEKAEVLDTYTQKNALQGESRSHGFFFKQNEDDEGGMFGLPIRKEGSNYSSLRNVAIEVIFVKVSEDKEFAYLGSLESNDTNQADDNCKVSCIDWYGNSRPIFYNDRIFALIGYEFIEGKITNNRLGETQRLGFGR